MFDTHTFARTFAPFAKPPSRAATLRMLAGTAMVFLTISTCSRSGAYGTAQNLDETRTAAEQGDASAQFHLGKLYGVGEKGVPQDHEEAIRWFRRAAEQGHANAQDILGQAFRQWSWWCIAGPPEGSSLVPARR